ncbi:indeterminate-domain 1 protein [Nymphaea thermarum]|nr:indeterminate-domain 1 protein [Nymphaea thermarum]
MATNRFICEVCNKGFQREQNLQLHRRGHNLPWKLKQKSTKEVKKKVYLCPESTCVHHDPSRALGDLTGIKKHYCRKHGEKKWKCEKCSKKYAVQSDWKAHSKICGTREYRCDCGTLFSRRDSFITHRAFCDALAQESARLPSGLHLYNTHRPPSGMLRIQGGGGGGPQFDHLITPSNSSLRSLPSFFPSGLDQNFSEGSQALNAYPGLTQIPSLPSNDNSNNNPAATLFNLGFLSNGSISNKNDGNNNTHLGPSGLSIHSQLNNNILSDHMSESVSSLYSSHMQNEAVLPHMSATALLHKAAQIGATATGLNNESMLGGGFGGSTANTTGFFGHEQRPSSSSSSFPVNNPSSFPITNLDHMRTNLNSSCQESHVQDIMNSLDSGGSALYGGSRIADEHKIRGAFGGNLIRPRSRDNSGDLGAFAFNNSMNLESGNMMMNNLEAIEDKLHPTAASNLRMGGSDRLTRDFLGVGGMNRGFVGGGFSQRDHHHEQNVTFGTMDLEMKAYNEGYLH